MTRLWKNKNYNCLYAFSGTKFYLLVLLLACRVLFSSDISTIDQYDSLLNQTLKDSSTKSRLDLNTIKKSKFSAKVGLVSLDLVYLFHPKMKNYNYLMNSFFTPIPKDLSIPLPYYLKNKLKAYKQYKKMYLVKESELQRSTIEIMKSLKRLKEEFLMSSETDLSTQEYRRQETNYWSERNILETKRKDLLENFEVWKSTNNKDFLMSNEERDQQSKQIVQEVQLIIDSIVEKDGLNFVFNIDSDIYGRTKKSYDLPAKTLFWQEYNDYSMLLKDELYFNYKKRGETYQYYSALSAHFSYYPKIKETFAQNFQSTAFVGKSQNISLKILKELFDRYGYSQTIKTQLLDLIRKSLKRGK
ncbi:MAG: hypothetical protein KC646_12525 [Candidatus Cloacimonetes bacterium]|nr:hypothetical protein [Candidatus Cloacimonadota bacterium]